MNSITPINDRFVNAESDFLDVLQKLGGVSRDGASKILRVWRAHKVVKVDSGSGRISVKHGAYLDRENILESFRHAIDDPVETCSYCRKYK